MRIASDGKPFDLDFIKDDAGPGEVEIIQFRRPAGRRQRVLAEVGEDLAAKARALVISAEDLGTGQVAIYVRRKGEPEEKEHTGLADNGPGENSPTKVLKRMIGAFAEPAIAQG